MAETKEIRAVEMVRRIRDELARELAGKSEAEIIAFYRKAGDAARESARRGQPSNPRMEPSRR
jgi:nucleosome binding factor SPN SPT16 subunit